MSQMPYDLHIGPYHYRVAWDDCMAQLENLYGDVDYGKQHIRIASDLGAGQTAAVLLHEVLHAVVECAAGLTENDECTAEQFVTCAAPQLLDTLRRNPALVAFLTADADG